MRKEELNIFDWRRQLRGLTPQGRVDFYYGELRKGYQQSVSRAENARQESKRPGDLSDQQIHSLFEIWASEATQKRLNTALERRRKRGLNVNKGEETVNLGLSGHFRIYQVHETTMAQKSPYRESAERRKRIQTAYNVFKDGQA